SPEIAKAAVRVFDRAGAQNARVLLDHAILSFQSSPVVSLPPSEAPNSGDIGDVIKEFSANFSTDKGNFKVRIEGVKFLKVLYDVMGFIDYYAFIKRFDKISCPPDKIPSGGVATESCFDVIVGFFPGGDNEERFIGTEGDLSDNLAVYILRSMVSRENNH